jgi:hypothetical protein
MATLIGLCIRVKLLRSLPQRFKVDIMIAPGTHHSEHAGKIIPWGFLLCCVDGFSFHFVSLVHALFTF